jgi:ADP-ribose pyrophosphatase
VVTTYTHPAVLGHGVAQGWADPRTDPAGIDWAARRAAATVPFEIVDGRPVSPLAPTGIRYGRNQLGHWGDAAAADMAVTAGRGRRWLLLVERGDGLGWALPGGMAEPGETALETAVRELAEETGLHLPAGAVTQLLAPRCVPDPRGSDESWVVTTVAGVHLDGHTSEASLPPVCGDDDARRAAWLPADDYDRLTAALQYRFGGRVFAAHEALLREVLDGPDEAAGWLRAYIDDVLAVAGPDRLRELAADYLRLVDALRTTMDDLADWEPEHHAGVTDRMTRYIRHLAEARHGVCDLCQHLITAAHPTTILPEQPWWHPQRWRHALADCGHALAGCARDLRYGRRRTAHRACALRHL